MIIAILLIRWRSSHGWRRYPGFEVAIISWRSRFRNGCNLRRSLACYFYCGTLDLNCWRGSNDLYFLLFLFYFFFIILLEMFFDLSSTLSLHLQGHPRLVSLEPSSSSSAFGDSTTFSSGLKLLSTSAMTNVEDGSFDVPGNTSSIARGVTSSSSFEEGGEYSMIESGTSFSALCKRITRSDQTDQRQYDAVNILLSKVIF